MTRSGALLSIEVDGFDNLHRVLGVWKVSIRNSIHRGALRSVAGKAKTVIKRQAKLVSRQSKYDVGHGVLARSLDYKVAQLKNNKDVFYMLVGPRRRYSETIKYYNSYTGKDVTVKITPTKYLQLLEKGFTANPFGIPGFHIKVQPHPVLEPAYYQNSEMLMTLMHRRYNELLIRLFEKHGAKVTRA